MDIKECRICFETENADDMFSPCRCAGTSKYVHRACLQRWRDTNREGPGFVKCMECNWKYLTDNKYPKEQSFVKIMPKKIGEYVFLYGILMMLAIPLKRIDKLSGSPLLELMDNINSSFTDVVNADDVTKSCFYFSFQISV